MIAQLTGTVSYKGVSYLILTVVGIGYKVRVPLSLITKTKENEAKTLWTHLHVREDSQELYGFDKKDELDLFEMLIAISGIGPKSALTVLNLAPTKNLVQAIGSGDVAYLTKVSGIGKKTAEKIILELKEKLSRRGSEFGVSELREDEEVIEALRAMGWSVEDARDTLNRIENKTLKTGDKIKEALKLLSRS